MCRILAISSDSLDPVKPLKRLLDSAKYDIYAIKHNFNCHDDGWGFSALLHGNNSILYYKTRAPIWLDKNFNSILELIKGKKITGIFHVRKASNGMPINSFSSHPYFFQLADGSSIYLVQNGGINREKGHLLLKNKSLNYKLFTDTYIYGLLLVNEYNKLEDNNSTDRIKLSILNVNEKLSKINGASGCMNTMILHISPDESARLVVVRKFNSDSLKNYCELYYSYDGSNYVACSSTLARGLPYNSFDKNTIHILNIKNKRLASFFF